MLTQEAFEARKDRAEEALRTAKILFPSSSATSPVDNSVQALLERLRLAEEEATSGCRGEGNEDVSNDNEVEALDKQELLRRGAERGLQFLETVQEWLILEGQKAKLGLSATDFLLSIQQRALIQRITQHVVGFLLLPTLKDLSEYVARGNPMRADAAEFIAFVGPFQRILRLSIPSTSGSSTESAEASSSPSSTPGHTTYITQTFRNATTLVHLMASAILVGWYESVARDPTSSLYRACRGFINTLGGRTETISVLGGVVRLTAPASQKTGINDPRAQASGAGEKVHVRWPSYVMAVARAMMARQITLPKGVMGLMNCIFGNGIGKNEVVDMRKLEYLAMCVGTPVNESIQSFLGKIVPQLIQILAPGTEVAPNRPAAYTSAASFCLSNLVARHADTAMGVLAPLVHSPFSPEAASSLGRLGEEREDQPSAVVVSAPRQINDALSILLPLLTATPPTAIVVTRVVTPILAPLFALAVYLQSDRTADPLTRQEVQDVLRAWARLADREVVVKGIWDILNSGRGWGVTDEEGNEFFWEHAGEEDVEHSGVGIWYGKPEKHSLLTKPDTGIDTSKIHVSTSKQEGQAQPPAVDSSEDDLLSKVDLIPPPKEITALLKKAERKEVTSALYVRCLQAYQELAQVGDMGEEHTKSLLLYLQLIMQITENMSDALGDQTDKVLIFIEQALRSSASEGESVDVDAEGADSDDEEGEEAGDVDAGLDGDLEDQDVGKLGLMETAIHLLLATLQSNPQVNAVDQPILAVIGTHVEKLTRHRLATVRTMARNAQLLLSIKNAMGSNRASSSSDTQSSTMEQYQEALRCLQDPLLPVRGHGLIILQGVVKAKDFDRALVPAIMDIFLQALRDDDSFMYLNAVRGLSSLVDGLGKEILATLASAYAAGVERGSSLQLSKDELDRRLRIGEALTQSIKRCGTALSVYADVLIPKLIRVFPQVHLPTVLRASSLSILSVCADIDWRAILPWAQDLLGACLDLLQLESVRASASTSRTSDSQPTPEPLPEPVRGHDSKHPALRRAALVFVGQLFNAVAISEQLEQERTSAQSMSVGIPPINMGTTRMPTTSEHRTAIHPGLMQKAGNVLGYLEATDVDSLAAHQAGEALALLRQLRWPMSGRSSS